MIFAGYYAHRMSELNEIQLPVAEGIRSYERLVGTILGSNSVYVNAICEYITANRGKQMRPLLVLLSAALNGGVKPRSLMAAALVELIHGASLVHDDIVDESDLRRGVPSVKAAWDSRTAVLVGDFIFARAYFYCIENDGIDILSEMTRSVHEIGEGELMQIEQSRQTDMDEELYSLIIEKKTASLIGASAAMGAISAGASQEHVDRMRSFGLCLGMAFQIKDDILDYSDTAVTGKPRGADVREGKINLPLLHVISTMDGEAKEVFMERFSAAGLDQASVDGICEIVVDRGGIEYAEKRMNEYLEAALKMLGQYPSSEVLRSMERLARYVVAREK